MNDNCMDMIRRRESQLNFTLYNFKILIHSYTDTQDTTYFRQYTRA